MILYPLTRHRPLKDVTKEIKQKKKKKNSMLLVTGRSQTSIIVTNNLSEVTNWFI